MKTDRDKREESEMDEEERISKMIDKIATTIADEDGCGLWGDYYRAAKKGAKTILSKLKATS